MSRRPVDFLGVFVSQRVKARESVRYLRRASCQRRGGACACFVVGQTPQVYFPGVWACYLAERKYDVAKVVHRWHNVSGTLMDGRTHRRNELPVKAMD
jgi:hypothetical protein